jgi:hypothetical protein
MSDVHVWPQRVCPAMQPEAHARVAALQNGAAPEHTVPQAPQLLGSVPRSTQALPHSLVPGGQPHVPPVHKSPGAHRAPHAPQLFASLVMSMQTPPQSTMPPGQRHTPPLHA